MKKLYRFNDQDQRGFENIGEHWFAFHTDPNSDGVNVDIMAYNEAEEYFTILDKIEDCRDLVEIYNEDKASFMFLNLFCLEETYAENI